MKEILLTHDQVALVDDEDYERINAHRWHAQRIRGTDSYYAIRAAPRDENGKKRTIYMHREVMNAMPGEEVDHIGHDRLDQQKKNLRICNRSQNNSNKRMQSNNTSGYKGVSWHRKGKKWEAKVQASGKKEHLGLFTTALEAALAYDIAAIKSQGDHALTNAMLGLIPSTVDFACAASQNVG